MTKQQPVYLKLLEIRKKLEDYLLIIGSNEGQTGVGEGECLYVEEWSQAHKTHSLFPMWRDLRLCSFDQEYFCPEKKTLNNTLLKLYNPLTVVMVIFLL